MLATPSKSWRKEYERWKTSPALFGGGLNHSSCLGIDNCGQSLGHRRQFGRCPGEPRRRIRGFSRGGYVYLHTHPCAHVDPHAYVRSLVHARPDADAYLYLHARPHAPSA